MDATRATESPRPAPDAAPRCRRRRLLETSSWRGPHPAESTASRPAAPRSAPRSGKFWIVWSTLRDVVLRILGEMQMLHDALEIAADLIQMTQADGRAQRFLQGLQGIAAVRSRMRHIVGYRGSARQHHVVAHRDVRRHHRVAPGDELPANFGRAAHHEPGGEEAVLAQI